MNEKRNGRYSLIAASVFALLLSVIIQVIRVQASPDYVETIRDIGVYYSTESRTLTPARGQIFDRWGNLLAANRTVYEIGVELAYVENPHTIALTLNAVLGLDYSSIFNIANLEYSENAVYATLANNVTPAEYEKLQVIKQQIDQAFQNSKDKDAPSLRGLVFRPRLGRFYPEKTLASNILGFVSREEKGYFGVEEYFDDLLSGSPQTVRVPKDPNRVEEMPSIPDGASIVLTIDRAIQRSMEQIIDEAVQYSGADSGTLVVLDPETGEVLAMAVTPRLDLNEFWRVGELFPEKTPFNRAVSQTYEPGSVFKIFTMASALDAGTVEPETTFVDTGVIEVGGLVIYNWDRGAWGPQTMKGCMQHSLNVCLAWVATQLGAADFYHYLQAFGIGHHTGIELSGEVSGLLKSTANGRWNDAELGTNSFGQGVSATPIQMAAAAAAMANDGKMMAPHIVRSVVYEGYQYDIEKRVVGMPISPETAHTITEMLADSLEVEASDALVPGYRVAGKTGTAEIATDQGYTSNLTNASFVGWGPVDDPKFLVYIWLEKPTISPWGSVVASPVFSQAVQKLVVLMNIPPDEVRLQLEGNQSNFDNQGL
jgi:cell division protein FtsI/penicillin-binding protein 2